jgi:hypothetical protein
MRIIKGTQDARRMKGMVVPGVRTLRCPCGAQAQPVGGSSKQYACGACGRKLSATPM